VNGSSWEPISVLQIKHGSHSVTCHLTQVNVPCLDSNQPDWYSIYLPTGMDAWVDLGGWLYTEMVYLSIGSQLSKQLQLDSDLIGCRTHDLVIINPTFWNYASEPCNCALSASFYCRLLMQKHWVSCTIIKYMIQSQVKALVFEYWTVQSIFEFFITFKTILNV